MESLWRIKPLTRKLGSYLNGLPHTPRVRGLIRHKLATIPIRSTKARLVYQSGLGGKLSERALRQRLAQRLQQAGYALLLTPGAEVYAQGAAVVVLQGA
ncbi:hypothetical protein GCM10011378_06100 [Hymenobacter glacieicola]|uniref:Uncharacterized protein n=1 Tax=Hymenobacter glacieicola TaxID=1562124 RepID=A0ABQ1WL63_9BACT|nr:hypothetical protein GCM10011378_06100 [Hymenobacter glacieicola]